MDLGLVGVCNVCSIRRLVEVSNRLFNEGFETLITCLFREFQCRGKIQLRCPGMPQPVLRHATTDVGKNLLRFEADSDVIVGYGSSVLA